MIQSFLYNVIENPERIEECYGFHTFDENEYSGFEIDTDTFDLETFNAYGDIPEWQKHKCPKLKGLGGVESLIKTHQDLIKWIEESKKYIGNNENFGIVNEQLIDEIIEEINKLKDGEEEVRI